MEKKKYFDELNIFRGLIVAWVIIGHSFDEGPTFLGFLHGYAYTFHMNAFMLLSGLLFASKFNRCNDIKAGAKIIAERAKRLLVPYFFFTAVSFVLKMMFESYAQNELSKNIVVDTLLCRNNPNGGLWFLYALFLISALLIIFKWVNKYVLLAISIVGFALTFVLDINFTPLSYIFGYSTDFILGIIIKEHYEKISENVNQLSKTKLFTITAVLTVLSFALTYIELSILRSEALEIFLVYFNIITWYFIAVSVNRFGLLKKANMIIGNYGMDIYMLGYYVQIAIRVVLGSMLGAPYVVYSVLMCILGLILPIPVSKFIVRKVYLFRAIMLGDFNKKKELKKD